MNPYLCDDPEATVIQVCQSLTLIQKTIRKMSEDAPDTYDELCAMEYMLAGLRAALIDTTEILRKSTMEKES